MLGLGNSLSRGGVPMFSNDYSLAFDGSDDKVDLGSDKPNDGTGAITISAWINPTTFGEGSRGYVITNGKMFLYVNDSDDKLTLSRDGETEHHSADDSISTGSWQHIAVASASDGTNTNFYVNGALSGDANQNVGTPVAGNTNTFIGNNNGGNRTFHGNMDEVSIWNTALSAGDISALYNSGVPTDLLSDSNSGNLVGWWRMGDGTIDGAGHLLIGDESEPSRISSDLQDATWNNNDMLYTGESDIQADANGYTGINTNAGVGNDDNVYGKQITFTAGRTYKIDFDVTPNSSVAVPHLWFGIGSATTGQLDTTQSSNTESVDETAGTHSETFTFTPSSTLTNYYPYIRHGTNAVYNYTVSAYSLIEITGNVGVMTNMASDDIVKDTP